MPAPVLDELLSEIREAARSVNAFARLQQVLRNSVRQPDSIANAIAGIDDDEVLLFEDETCSVWSCRYQSDVVFAPHEHCMTAHIAVYRGAELEVMYQCESAGLRHTGNKVVSAGEVLTLPPDAIHAVSAEGQSQSHAIHVYQGPLTGVTRSLFDWSTGARVEFSMDNFYAMRRQKSEMSEFS